MRGKTIFLELTVLQVVFNSVSMCWDPAKLSAAFPDDEGKESVMSFYDKSCLSLSLSPLAEDKENEAEHIMALSGKSHNINNNYYLNQRVL